MAIGIGGGSAAVVSKRFGRDSEDGVMHNCTVAIHAIAVSEGEPPRSAPNGNRFRLTIRLLRLIGPILGLLGAWYGTALAQGAWDLALTRPGWNLPEFKESVAALRRGDCRTAWDVVWPLAKQGNPAARYLLWSSTIGRMVPPGERSRSMWERHHLILAVYATLVPPELNPPPGDTSHAWARREIPNTLKRMDLGPNGERVAQCYRSGEPFQACLDLGLSLGVIQRFEDYAADVDASARESGVSASCHLRH